VPESNTNGWKLKDADVLTSLDDRKIAILRLGLAISAFFIVFLDPSEQASYSQLTVIALTVYAVYSAAIWMASRRRPFSWAVFVALLAIDIAVCTVLITVSGGTTSVFFFFYFFPVIVGGIRGGNAFGFGVTAISACLFTIFGIYGNPETIELRPFLARSIYLLALGYVISLWASAEIRLKSKLELLNQLSLTTARFNMDRSIAGLMERLADFYYAAGCVLLLANPKGESYRLHRIRWQSSKMNGDSVQILGENDCPLLRLSSFSAAVYRQRDGFGGRFYEQCEAVRVENSSDLLECCSQTAEWMDARSFITAPMRYGNKTLGQICLTSGRPSKFDKDDAIFLQQIVDQIIPVLENVRLVDRLATDAAEHERGRIARSIHDRVIQPYLGLQMGLDVVRQSLQSEILESEVKRSPANGLRSVELLDRLWIMTKEGVEELREYVYGLQRPDGRKARMVDSIGRFASQFSDVTGIDVEIVDKTGDAAIHDRLAAEVFQIVTEALSNVRRHTRANRVVINLESAENTLVIRCENDDPGEVSRRQFRPGSIGDRAEALGGRIHVSSEGGHTAVLVEVPL